MKLVVTVKENPITLRVTQVGPDVKLTVSVKEQRINLAVSVGSQGAVGIQGVQGATGPRGIQGLTGDQGPQGVQGVAGATGPAGPMQAVGFPFWTAAGVFDALPLIDGDTALDFYVASGASDPINLVSV